MIFFGFVIKMMKLFLGSFRVLRKPGDNEKTKTEKQKGAKDEKVLEEDMCLCDLFRAIGSCRARS